MYSKFPVVFFALAVFVAVLPGCSPARLAEEIAKHIPEFTIDYDVDPVRQAVANSWPRSIDDSAARAEWDWAPAYDLESMTRDMIEKLTLRAAP